VVTARSYDWMYRLWAPWDSVGVRDELVALLQRKGIDATTHPLAVDLGCGTGANVVYLAQRGHRAVGVDFSRVALGKARDRARGAGVEDACLFVEADLTAPVLPGVEGPFDLLLDFGTLDDLKPDGRRAMAATVKRLSRPGSVFLFWCFYGDPCDLPRFSLTGPSRITPLIHQGEETELFGDLFDIESPRKLSGPTACFLMSRR
jgi:SAM-dependent methyltransferase